MKLNELLGDAYKEGMTVEDIETALSGITLPDQSKETEKLKAALSKSNSEAADYKRQLRERMSAEEAAKQKEAEERAELESKNKELFHRLTVSETKEQLVSIGYDATLASEAAEALVSGDLPTVIANQKKHQEQVEQKIKAEVLKGTPKPIGGSEHQITRDDLKAMTQMERFEFASQNPEEYKALYGGK